MFRDMRVKYHLTQAQLGEMLGLTRNQVARVERGESRTSRATLLLLERIDRELSESRNLSDDSASSN